MGSIIDRPRLVRWFNIRQLDDLAAANPERREDLQEWLLDHAECEETC